MEQTASFRSAAFGGFQRQDVLDYLKKSAQEHNDRVAELNQTLLETERRQTELETALTAAQEELAQTKAQAEEDHQRCQTLEQELEQAREQLRGYERLKSDYADIELEARCRAAQLLDSAEAQAAAVLNQTRSEADTLLENTRQEAERLIGEINAALSGALDQTEQTRGLLLELSDCMEERLRAVRDLCGEEK